ncbi:MAG: PQQ-binding-like beta-propeller repeat protein [Verrucomicrobiae bacterium]|nr:PQQ-binding-like beta-propeller repeat protein [Verrucomicrobiae bacterium]
MTSLVPSPPRHTRPSASRAPGLLFSAVLALLLLVPARAATPEPGLLARWRFSPEWKQGTDLKAMTGGPGIRLTGPMRFTADPPPGRLELAGTEPDLVIAPDASRAMLPAEDFTIEVWVRVDEPVASGGIVGLLNDDGEPPIGWRLGHRDRQFTFVLGMPGLRQPVELTAPSPFDLRRWYQLAATRSGTDLRLWINGVPVATAVVPEGRLHYPPETPFEVGVRRRDTEVARLRGALHEISLFQRALTPDELGERSRRRLPAFPEPAPPAQLLRFAYGPFADWRDRHTVLVTWETDTPMPTRFELENAGTARFEVGSEVPVKRHEALLTGLQRDREYHYRINAPDASGIPVRSRRYLLDTSFHYALPEFPPSAGASPDAGGVSADAEWILDQTGIRDGYCLVVGAVDGRLAAALAAQSHLQVVVVDPSADRIARVRRELSASGAYGVRVSAQVIPGDSLPFGELFANLIVSEAALATGEPPPLPAAELHRVLRPQGGTLLVGSRAPRETAWKAWREAAANVASLDQPRPGWVAIRRDPLPGAGEWSHQYGSADNTSTSLDELVDGDLRVAWWGNPGPRPMPDRGNRNPAPLSVGGRLFIQGDRILFGLDAYNGTILWSLFAPEVRRANVTRDCSNMAAAGDRLYVAHGRWCLALDGQSGERVQRFAVTGDGTEARHDWGYVAAVAGHLVGSRQLRDANYLGDDGEWYEDFDTQQTSRVTSDQIFSTDPVGGARRWTHSGGAILNSTITIADGMVLFLESRDPAAVAQAGARLPHERLTDQVLVALDLETGKPLWEKSHDFGACEFMTYLVYSQGTAVVTGTDQNKNFHTFAFAAPSPGRTGGDDLDSAIPGRLLWADAHKEDKGHHSGHLQHPLVIDDVFYSDQRAFDLRSGRLLRTDLPERRGCGVMSASRRAVFFRHYFHGVWDLASDRRSQFSGIRTGCWLGLIPAGGLLLAPESSAGCSCTHAIQTSVGFLPRAMSRR